MKKEFFELVKKGFVANKDAQLLYFTKDGKPYLNLVDAEKAAIETKDKETIDHGYTVVRRDQLEALEASFVEDKKVVA